MNQAPLHELEDFSCSGGQAFFYDIDEENQLRTAFWNLQSTKGTIILQSGRTEFIEKYYEVIEEFVFRGFAVAMMDWRGQGLSSRTAKDKRLGHIDKFETYDEDFKSVMSNCFESKCPKPFIGFGHSMGGCLLTSYFISEDNLFDKCILCAPMVSVRANSLSRRIVRALGMLEILGLGSFPMQKPSWDEEKGWTEEPFEENALTSDKRRFNRSYRLISRFPELGVKGISVGWLKHALKRTNQFKSLDWTKAVKNPLLLLDATEDKLVNSQLNKDLLGQSSLVTIRSINSQHEIMMENDEIREEAWKAIDLFLKTES
jgi:lysophospholipase